MTGYLSENDYGTIFKQNSSIISLRIADQDTTDGSIKFERQIDALESMRRIFTQAVTFTTTRKPIFGNAKQEVEAYLNNCRSLQTEQGSYVTKFNVPKFAFGNLFDELNSQEVNSNLFTVLDFLNQEVFKRKEAIELNERYVVEYSNYINYELLTAIKTLYLKASITNAEFTLDSFDNHTVVSTEKVLPRMRFFVKYIQDIKSILLQDLIIEFTGRIKKLSSVAPKTSSRNNVYLEADLSGTKQSIKLVLDSKRYLEAVDAHKNERVVKVKGKVRQGVKTYVMEDVESFTVN